MVERDKANRKKRDVSEETKMRHAAEFLEEFYWFYESVSKKFKFEDVAEIIRKNSDHKHFEKEGGDLSSSRYLVGILPGFFSDSEIFPKNDDIAKFANELLKINIKRVEKRSRYELIGLIVCEVSELDGLEVDYLVSKLRSIKGDKEIIKKVAKSGYSIDFSWNEMIRGLGDR